MATVIGAGAAAYLLGKPPPVFTPKVVPANATDAQKATILQDNKALHARKETYNQQLIKSLDQMVQHMTPTSALLVTQSEEYGGLIDLGAGTIDFTAFLDLLEALHRNSMPLETEIAARIVDLNAMTQLSMVQKDSALPTVHEFYTHVKEKQSILKDLGYDRNLPLNMQAEEIFLKLLHQEDVKFAYRSWLGEGFEDGDTMDTFARTMDQRIAEYRRANPPTSNSNSRGKRGAPHELQAYAANHTDKQPKKHRDEPRPPKRCEICADAKAKGDTTISQTRIESHFTNNCSSLRKADPRMLLRLVTGDKVIAAATTSESAPAVPPAVAAAAQAPSTVQAAPQWAQAPATHHWTQAQPQTQWAPAQVHAFATSVISKQQHPSHGVPYGYLPIGPPGP
jgi:hypothetical protein